VTTPYYAHTPSKQSLKGGNSGSPVVHEETGLAIGIHTHGGCSNSGGANSGTKIYGSSTLLGHISTLTKTCTKDSDCDDKVVCNGKWIQIEREHVQQSSPFSLCCRERDSFCLLVSLSVPSWNRYGDMSSRGSMHGRCARLWKWLSDAQTNSISDTQTNVETNQISDSQTVHGNANVQTIDCDTYDGATFLSANNISVETNVIKAESCFIDPV
jgi:hypothetical protein